MSTEDFLQRWIASPSSRVCGRWQTQYGALHQSIRAGHAPKRYITFDNPANLPSQYPRPGLGDYLVGMVSAFLAGKGWPDTV